MSLSNDKKLTNLIVGFTLICCALNTKEDLLVSSEDNAIEYNDYSQEEFYYNLIIIL